MDDITVSTSSNKIMPHIHWKKTKKTRHSANDDGVKRATPYGQSAEGSTWSSNTTEIFHIPTLPSGYKIWILTVHQSKMDHCKFGKKDNSCSFALISSFFSPHPDPNSPTHTGLCSLWPPATQRSMNPVIRVWGTVSDNITKWQAALQLLLPTF